MNSYLIQMPSTSSSKVPIRKVELKGTKDFFNVFYTFKKQMALEFFKNSVICNFNFFASPPPTFLTGPNLGLGSYI